MKRILKNAIFTILFTSISFLGLSSGRASANTNCKKLTTGNYYYTYIYNKNGEKRSTYKGKSAHLTSPHTFTYEGNPKKIKKNYYYQIGNNAFIKTSDVGILNGKTTLQLNYNSQLYNKAGKKLHKPFLSKKFPVTTHLSLTKYRSNSYYYVLKNKKKYYLPTKKINGKYYFLIKKGEYIKAYNVKFINNGSLCIKELPSKVIGTFDGEKTAPLFDQHGKVISKRINVGSKIKLDAFYSDDRNQYYFKIKNTNYYISSLNLNASYKVITTKYIYHLPLAQELPSTK